MNKTMLSVALATVCGWLGTSNFALAYDHDYWRDRGSSCRQGCRPRPCDGPVYHAPSVHYDRVYHQDYSHWTPRRGWHSHGHYDVVPHYVPGHYDYQHRRHLHLNPRYHH